MFKNNKGLWLLVVALAVVAGLLAPAVPAASSRLIVRVPEPFEINGTLYQPGELSLRSVREFSPIATLNEIRVDGHSLGVMLAREHAGAVLATRDEVIFERAESGRLVLASVALQGEPVRKLYRLEVGNSRGTWQAVSHVRPALIASAK